MKNIKTYFVDWTDAFIEVVAINRVVVVLVLTVDIDVSADGSGGSIPDDSAVPDDSSLLNNTPSIVWLLLLLIPTTLFKLSAIISADFEMAPRTTAADVAATVESSHDKTPSLVFLPITPSFSLTYEDKRDVFVVSNDVIIH